MASRSRYPKLVLALCSAFLILAYAFIMTSCAAKNAPPAGQPLTSTQHDAVKSALAKMQSSGLTSYAKLGNELDSQGKWMFASPNDPYIAQSQKSGDTPFAYTLPDSAHPKQPVAIVLAPRFFTDADPTAQAALMVHELGHWMAFQRKGSSTEYDGYKTEFDTHKQLGLTEADNPIYIYMLDGVSEYVVPVDKSYAKQPEVAAYIKESSTGEM
jgi:hypothetical protein